MNNNQIVLCNYPKDNEVTIKKYNELIENENKIELTEFVYNRLYSRYIRPFKYIKKEYKNGFSMMASYCLLIETLQSFKNGWGDTKEKSKEAFRQFFENNDKFDSLNNRGEEFYYKIRCGILHQGETTGGWKIRRDGELVENKTINATKFGMKLEETLKEYREELKKSDWDSEILDNFRVKMRKIIKNCKE